MCDDIIALAVNGTCACVFLCLKFSSVFIFSTVNIDSYNPHRQKLLRILNNFRTVEGPETKKCEKYCSTEKQ